MNRALSGCPVCSNALYVSELACGACGTRINGAFEACSFCRLSPDQLQFVQIFLGQRGNLSGVGGELGISYPTVAKRLDAILRVLGLNGHDSVGHEAEVDSAESDRHIEHARLQILEALDRGDITAEEATRRLKDL